MTVGRDDQLGNNWLKPGDEERAEPEKEEMEESGGGRGAEVIPQQGDAWHETKDIRAFFTCRNVFFYRNGGKIAYCTSPAKC